MLEQFIDKRQSMQERGSNSVIEKFLHLIEGDPGLKRRANILAQAFHDGFDRESDAIGMHGTSVEAVMRFIQTGSLTGVSDFGGDIYLFPLPENIKELNLQGSTFKEVHKNASGFAQLTSRAHYIAGRCGAEKDHNAWEDIRGFLVVNAASVNSNTKKSTLLRIIGEFRESDQGFDSWLSTKDINNEDFASIIMDALSYQGIVLLVNKNITERLKVVPGDANDEIRITGGTITCEDIIGIDALGKDEEAFLNKLSEVSKI